MARGIDVTAGGAKYNFSCVQMIQVANLADSLTAIKQLVYDEKIVSREELSDALQKNFEGYDILRARLLNKVPKYGNDVEWVDIAAAGTTRECTPCRLTSRWVNDNQRRLAQHEIHANLPDRSDCLGFAPYGCPRTFRGNFEGRAVFPSRRRRYSVGRRNTPAK